MPLWWDAAIYLRQGLSSIFRGRLRKILGTEGQRSFMKQFTAARLEREVAPAGLVGTVVEVDNVRLKIDPSLSEWKIRQIATGSHTQPERQLVLRALEPHDVVMELGGGIGMVSIACAQRIGSDRVFSYEANPDLQPLIQENYRLNGVRPEMNMCILGKDSGEAVFHVSQDFGSSSVHPPDKLQKSVTVPIKPFEDEVTRIKPTFLIVDIEGGEDDFFAHARLDSVKKIVLEVHPHICGARRTIAIRRRIRAAGFKEESDDGLHYLYRLGQFDFEEHSGSGG